MRQVMRCWTLVTAAMHIDDYPQGCGSVMFGHTFSNLLAFLSVARTTASSDRCFKPVVTSRLGASAT